MDFINGVKNIQAVGYNGARTVYSLLNTWFFQGRFFIFTIEDYKNGQKFYISSLKAKRFAISG